ncbi:MAG: hypothetical protein AA908_03565 [Chlorobi bacterium NICIL-2]|mgnify:CR=1 FL=1|nr:MAG: hypothetical protein AA908_03565 [Chlorobi bacterium NICIL-2]
MSRLTTLLALGAGIVLVAAMAALATGTLAFLWNPEAITIVLGGSILATVAASSPMQVVSALRWLGAITKPRADELVLAEWWLQLALRWRHEGISGLKVAASSAPSDTAAAIAELCADGLDAESIVALAEELVQTRHRSIEQAIAFYRRLAGYAPTMGIIGTVIGLAAALGSTTADPVHLLQRIGFAFSATLWGLVTANFLWLPLAQRLQVALDDQRALDRLHIQAARYAAEGITPLLMRYRLAMLLPEERRNQLLRQ